MKRTHLADIESKYKIENYKDLYKQILSLIEQEKIKPVKASGLNVKKPALYKEYQEDREWLKLLNEYLKTNREKLETPVAMSERSFAIWHRERFLKEERGKKLLKRCGFSPNIINFYEKGRSDMKWKKIKL